MKAETQRIAIGTACGYTDIHVGTFICATPEPSALQLKRFDPVQHYDQGGTGYGQMKECDDGDFVRADEALAALSTARAALARFVIDECDAHHNFVKLDGAATRCPHCLAIGLESARAALAQCEERVKEVSNSFVEARAKLGEAARARDEAGESEGRLRMILAKEEVDHMDTNARAIAARAGGERRKASARGTALNAGMKSQSKLESRIAELEATIAVLTAAHAKALEDGKRQAREIEVLRSWGNKDCTKMADAVLDEERQAATPATTGKDGAT